MNVGLIGATGYAGLELVHLLDKHPIFHLTSIGSRSHSNLNLKELHAAPLKGNYTLDDLETFEASINSLDAVFLSLPHRQSMPWVKKLHSAGIPVIDLSGDFRLSSPELYEKWYEVDHTAPELFDLAVYGLPELNKNTIASSNIIANPGCYPTATALGLLPLAKAGLLNDKKIIIDAKSGMSGAGKSLNQAILYCESNESMRPYGTGTHRHTPEIEETLTHGGAVNVSVLFSPSVVPMERGILSSIYVSLDSTISITELKSLYESEYNQDPFVRIIDKMPETRWTKGTNYCDIHIVLDERTNTLIIHSAIDNLVKGAAGQAIQNANIRFGLDETTGLI